MIPFTYIKFVVRDAICTITLNRPYKRNALNDKLVEELSKAVLLAEGDESVKVIILKAEGKAFCAGADLEYLEKISKNSYEENLKDSIALKDLFYKIYTSKKIVIAQVQGHAIAGGTGLVSVCDFSFAVPDATFGYTEVKLGFIPAIVAVFLIDKIGEGKARELLLTGKLIDAPAAKVYGIITAVVQPEELEAEVLRMAEELASNTSKTSILMTKELIRKIKGKNFEDQLNFACTMNAEMRQTEDFKKGISAFLKKETPKWI